MPKHFLNNNSDSIESLESIDTLELSKSCTITKKIKLENHIIHDTIEKRINNIDSKILILEQKIGIIANELICIKKLLDNLNQYNNEQNNRWMSYIN